MNENPVNPFYIYKDGSIEHIKTGTILLPRSANRTVERIKGAVAYFHAQNENARSFHSVKVNSISFKVGCTTFNLGNLRQFVDEYEIEMARSEEPWNDGRMHFAIGTRFRHKPSGYEYILVSLGNMQRALAHADSGAFLRCEVIQASDGQRTTADDIRFIMGDLSRGMEVISDE